MDCIKIGRLIYDLRKEKGMTQKALADCLNVSDKAVSKWERGLGCPDISIWPNLADILGADIKKLLEGELYPNEPDRGNIKRINFYVCKECGNIMTSTSKCSLSCCGRKITPLQNHHIRADHHMNIGLDDDYYYVTLDHEMAKDHYIAFIAFVTDASVWINRLYPEQSAETRIPASYGRGTMFAYCTKHGLLAQTVKKKDL